MSDSKLSKKAEVRSMGSLDAIETAFTETEAVKLLRDRGYAINRRRLMELRNEGNIGFKQERKGTAVRYTALHLADYVNRLESPTVCEKIAYSNTETNGSVVNREETASIDTGTVEAEKSAAEACAQRISMKRKIA